MHTEKGEIKVQSRYSWRDQAYNVVTVAKNKYVTCIYPMKKLTRFHLITSYIKCYQKRYLTSARSPYNDTIVSFNA